MLIRHPTLLIRHSILKTKLLFINKKLTIFPFMCCYRFQELVPLAEQRASLNHITIAELKKKIYNKTAVN
ncbi:hypothetical protein Hanom_Chr16g01443591 [Helianthus anomalus]